MCWEGGTHIWSGQGVLLEPRNPYPLLRVILAENGTHLLGFFLKYRPISHNFEKFWEKNGHMSKYSFEENGTHVKGFLVIHSNPFEQNIPIP